MIQTHQCLVCQEVVDFDLSLLFLLSFKKIKFPLLCDHCLTSFKPLKDKENCPMCFRPYCKYTYCFDCQKWMDIYPKMGTRHEALFEYNESAKEWLKKLKFQGDTQIGESLEAEFGQRLKEYMEEYIIVPIPSSSVSLTERGFNQVEVLLDCAKISYQNILNHKGTLKRQALKNRKERLKSDQPFYIKNEQKMKLIDKSVLLVDDVYTTGRTLFHAKDYLYKSGAERVESFTIFR